MTTMTAVDRQSLADMLRRKGSAAVMSELAWLLVEADLMKLLVEQQADPKVSVDLDPSASAIFLSDQACSARGSKVLVERSAKAQGNQSSLSTTPSG